jgi:hypothetical protein
MENQLTPAVVEQHIEEDLLAIVELEDRLELAAADRCNNRCNGNDYPDVVSL